MSDKGSVNAVLRKPETENLICSNLIEMMKTAPFYHIKVSHLVERAGIARSTFYFYFDSIYAVVQKIEDEFIDGMPEAITAGISRSSKFEAESLSKEVYAGVNYIKQNIEVFGALSGKNGDPGFQARLINRSWKLVKARFAVSNDSTDIEKRLVIEYLLAGQWNLFKFWAYHGKTISVEEVCLLVGKLMSQAFNLL